MPDHAYPLYENFQSSWRGCSFVREWICRCISIVLQSIVFLLSAGRDTSQTLFSELIPEGSSHYSFSTYMDIIEISSSESDDDVGFGDSESQDIYFTDGDTNNWRNTFEMPIHMPQLNGHAEEKQQAKSSLQQSQKRTFPHSLELTAFRHAPKYGLGSHGELVIVPQPKESTHVELNIRTEVELDNVARDKQELDAEHFQHSHKKTFPSSHQPSSYVIASEVSVDCQDGSHFDSGKADPSDSKVFMGDDAAPKFDEFSYVDNGKHRILPKSIGNGQVKAFLETGGSSQNLNFSHSLGANALHRFPTNSRDDNLIYDKSGTHRVLPPSLVHGKVAIGSQPTGAGNDANHLALGEERHFELDERVIYEEALQNLNQPKFEDDLPEGLLTVPLLKHQKIALAWMVQKEKSVHCAGGILADDQGLGKTISMISLIQKQMTQQSKFRSDDSCNIRSETLNLDEDDDGVSVVDKTLRIEKDDVNIEKDDPRRKPIASTSMHASSNCRPPAGTLVVCPASVLRQWACELHEKVADTARLSVLVYHGGARTKYPSDLAKYDVVLTTYAIVTNEVPKQNLADDDDGEQKNMDKYGLTPEFFTNKRRKQTSNAHGRAKKKGKGLKKSHIDYDSGPLARVRWFRVVLDEAQTIKNYRTQVARACCGLRAKRRWCLSGTPIQNSIDDLYSYFRFLKYDPYAVYSSFCSSIKFPISRNAQHGYKKLQAVLKTILLRRTKDTIIDGEPIVKIPPKSMSLKKIDFSPDERDFYVRLETNSRQQFKEYDDAGTVKQNYANILVMLLRLRQACDHPSLVKENNSDTVEKHSLDMAKQLPRDMLIKLLNQLDSLSICGVCNDPPEDAVVTICGHVFCYQCVSDRLTGDDNQCPKPGCKEMLGTDIVFTRATLKICMSDNVDNNATSSSAYDEESVIVRSNYVSSKIRAALEILNSVCNQSSKVHSVACNEVDRSLNRAFNLMSEDPRTDNAKTHMSAHLNSNSNSETPVKAIVFSQWTGMLDLLEDSLNRFLIQYRRLDGTMSLASRDTAVKDFNTDPEVTVMLMSLKAGNLGLNMTAASHVILLDLWWNPAAEDQAVDRAHRIGQTRPVTISRLTINDTVEDRILALQEEKRMMISSAFGEDQSGSHATRLTVEDLRYLFRM